MVDFIKLDEQTLKHTLDEIFNNTRYSEKCQEAFESFQRSTKYSVRNSSMVDRIRWSGKWFSIHQERGSEHVPGVNAISSMSWLH